MHMYLQVFNHNYLKLCKDFYKELKQTEKISVHTLCYEVSWLHNRIVHLQ